jgi:hypothetical protein
MIEEYAKQEQADEPDRAVSSTDLCLRLAGSFWRLNFHCMCGFTVDVYSLHLHYLESKLFVTKNE